MGSKNRSSIAGTTSLGKHSHLGNRKPRSATIGGHKSESQLPDYGNPAALVPLTKQGKRRKRRARDQDWVTQHHTSIE